MLNLSYQIDYFKYILKKYGDNTNKPQYKYKLIKLKIGSHLKLKKGYTLELITKETMKLLSSSESKITKDKDGEEVVLVHCNIVNNDYQHDLRVSYTFVPNKPFGSLLKISPTNHIFLKAFNSKYNEIKIWFTDQNGQPLEIEQI